MSCRVALLPTIVHELGAPDVMCLQELRIRRQDADAVAALEGALPGYCCYHSLPRDARNVTFRGGRAYGVATFVRGRWRAEVPAWDLEGRVVKGPGIEEPFAFDNFVRYRLLNGLDDIGLTLTHEDELEEFEKTRPDYLPRVQ